MSTTFLQSLILYCIKTKKGGADMEFAKNLKRIRLDRDMNQSELSKRLNVL